MLTHRIRAEIVSLKEVTWKKIYHETNAFTNGLAKLGLEVHKDSDNGDRPLMLFYDVFPQAIYKAFEESLNGI